MSEWLSDTEHARIVASVLMQRSEIGTIDDILSRLPDEYGLKKVLEKAKEAKEEIGEEEVEMEGVEESVDEAVDELKEPKMTVSEKELMNTLLTNINS